ncbi:hypothetical protein RCO28_15790 [Streptomyces sp. LHD-70]|uniref:hypothetical protein n=1 Tax=Streptomyces sp. LHD-70 TaxID=3072140 RepID=UPI00280C7D47|nr:hypothetical protein [Streptomyces sp. LHD-70]MDQ8703945.1 hypothetical protein [Streptomyces sp. LHD-70]
MPEEPPLVRDVHPELIGELGQSIRTSDHPAGQPFGAGHRCVPLLPEQGMLTLDVVHGRIVYVEIIDRPPLVVRRRT